MTETRSDLIPRCDFCNRELRLGSTWIFPCRTHPAPTGAPLISEGNWAACSKCKEFILAGKREKLARRGAHATLHIAPPGTTLEQAQEATRRVQDTFWQHREGPPWLESREEWERGVEPMRIERRDEEGL